MAHQFGRWFGQFLREVRDGEARWSDLMPQEERKIVSSVVRERDMAIAHFSLRALSREERLERLMKAAKCFAHRLRNHNEPGDLVDAHLIGDLLTDALTGSTARGWEGLKQLGQPAHEGRVDCHLLIETIGLLMLVEQKHTQLAEEARAAVNEGAGVESLAALGPPRPSLPDPTAQLRVLVTGADGFLGGAVVRRLLASGATVTAASVGGMVRPPADLATNERCRWVPWADSTDADAAAALCHGQHAVVHAATLDQPGPAYTWLHRAAGPANLAFPSSAALVAAHVQATTALVRRPRRRKPPSLGLRCRCAPLRRSAFLAAAPSSPSLPRLHSARSSPQLSRAPLG